MRQPINEPVKTVQAIQASVGLYAVPVIMNTKGDLKDLETTVKLTGLFWAAIYYQTDEKPIWWYNS